MEKSITSHQYAVFLRELRRARRKAGVTQLDLAARIGETQSFVSKCERGERRLDIVEVRAFCHAMGLAFPVFTRELDRMLDRESQTEAK